VLEVTEGELIIVVETAAGVSVDGSGTVEVSVDGSGTEEVSVDGSGTVEVSVDGSGTVKLSVDGSDVDEVSMDGSCVDDKKGPSERTEMLNPLYVLVLSDVNTIYAVLFDV
jgi:hypothetical protein